MHNNNSGPDEDSNRQSCIISFDSILDMDKAFEELIYNSTDGFVGVDEMSIEVTEEQCEQLKRSNINYKHVC
jgi:hypothetical protein